MHRTGGAGGSSRRGEPNAREFSRIPVVIPVRVEVLPAQPAAGFHSVPGAVLDIGRGGARVRVRWEFQSRARLFISLPVGSPGLRLPAEVVWACPGSDRGSEPAAYGVRWLGPLSSGALASVLLRQGLAATWEVAHARGSWWR
jgi:hypothetical protein